MPVNALFYTVQHILYFLDCQARARSVPTS
jgi:hypothetical protein